MKPLLWGQAVCPGPGSQHCPPLQIAIHTLWNIRIVVLAKPEHENRISHICTDNVKTGIANTLGELGWGGVFCVSSFLPTLACLSLLGWVVLPASTCSRWSSQTTCTRGLPQCF